jgi:hypothetical protein
VGVSDSKEQLEDDLGQFFENIRFDQRGKLDDLGVEIKKITYNK